MERSYERIVNFYLCNFCIHKKKDETEEPCCECLDTPSNIDSRRPVKFKDNGSLRKLFEQISKGE